MRLAAIGLVACAAIAGALPNHAAHAQDPQWNCDEPMTQRAMNWCAHQDYLAADRLLNAQWPKTANAMKQRDADWDFPGDERPGFFATLLEAQRAWLRFRDAHCTAEGYLYRGGSIEPLIVSTCKTELTETRTEQLHQLESLQ